MDKEFIPYAEALALKELGFDEPCCGMYYNKKFNEIAWANINEQTQKGDSRAFYELKVSAPLYQQAFRWFREKHDLMVVIQTMVKDSWLLRIESIDSTTINGVYNGKRWHLNDDEDYVDPKYYEEAELACLEKLIEIVKTK